MYIQMYPGRVVALQKSKQIKPSLDMDEDVLLLYSLDWNQLWESIVILQTTCKH